jgi:hypothetical protein
MVYQVDLASGGEYVIPIETVSVQNPYAVCYDPVDERVYWSDVDTHTINSAQLDGSDAKVLVNGVGMY